MTYVKVGFFYSFAGNPNLQAPAVVPQAPTPPSSQSPSGIEFEIQLHLRFDLGSQS